MVTLDASTYNANDIVQLTQDKNSVQQVRSTSEFMNELQQPSSLLYITVIYLVEVAGQDQ